MQHRIGKALSPVGRSHQQSVANVFIVAEIVVVVFFFNLPFSRILARMYAEFFLSSKQLRTSLIFARELLKPILKIPRLVGDYRGLIVHRQRVRWGDIALDLDLKKSIF